MEGVHDFEKILILMLLFIPVFASYKCVKIIDEINEDLKKMNIKKDKSKE